jgi:hypothetical protein
VEDREDAIATRIQLTHNETLDLTDVELKCQAFAYRSMKEEEAMCNECKFEGTSNEGDLQEALEKAIDAATNELKQNFVRWKLDEVSGSRGGITGATEITVTIRVESRRN